MKTKVQAQRKFAQGAFIPPSAPAVSIFPERRAVDPPSEKGLNVFNNNTSAKKILDAVAFSHPGMHVHTPIVLLKRLPEKKIKPAPVNPVSIEQNKKNSDHNKSKEINRSSLFLRSQTNFNKTNKKTGIKKKVPKRNERIKTKKLSQTSRVLRSKASCCEMQSSSCDTNSEDDKPLAYHINKLKQKARRGFNCPPVLRKRVLKLSTFKEQKKRRPEKAVHSLPKSERTKPIIENETDKAAADGSELNGADTVVNSEAATPAIPDSTELVSRRDNVSPDTTESINVATYSEDNVLPEQSMVLYYNDSEDTMPDSTAVLEIIKNTKNDDSSDRSVSDDCSSIQRAPAINDEVLNNTNEKIPSSSEVTYQAGVTRNAPVYYPTEAEFNDPLAYYEKIKPEAAKFGLCKVVAPASFKPTCTLAGLDRFSVAHQYISRLFKRWGEGTRDMCAIRTYLASHNVFFTRPPLIDGLEVNLPKMFKIVQKYGGFVEVSRKKKWTRVAEEMNFIRVINPEKKLDQLYVKFLLPYDILSGIERESLNIKIEDRWLRTHNKLLKRAKNPLHVKKVILGESETSSDEEEPVEEEDDMGEAMGEVEECVKRGRLVLLSAYKKIDNNAVQMFFPTAEPTVEDIESFYWQTVLQATDHICVYTASIDTSASGYGFTTDEEDKMSRHSWNLKNIRNNAANILRSLGAVVSVTSPILHLGMLFSTNCWHRDPHGLPWIEYLHEGKEKIWYGIPDQQSNKFRRAVERLCPTSVQNKTVWLPSDISMVPPKLLLSEGVTLTRTTQKPGEYIFIFPKAYSSSICTGFTISESVYFAVQPWPITIHQVFQELRDSCEPMMFAPEQLLISLSRDPRVPLALLQQVYPNLVSMINEELDSRFALVELGLVEQLVGRPKQNGSWNVRDEDECDVCRRPLFLSKVKGRFHCNFLSKTCPQHAQQILLKQSPKELAITLETLVPAEELKKILSDVQNKLLKI